MNFDATTGTIIIAVVVVVANGIGAAINNGRIASLRLLIEQKFSSLHARLSVLEATRQQDRRKDQ